MEKTVATQLLTPLIGHPAVLTFGDPRRPEVLSNCVFWGLFLDNSVALAVTTRDVFGPSHEVMSPGSAIVTPTDKTLIRNFDFRWIPVESILHVVQDSGVAIEVKARRLVKENVPPLYSDGKAGWEVLDKGLKYHVERKLFEMGMRAEAPVHPDAEAGAVEVSGV